MATTLSPKFERMKVYSRHVVPILLVLSSLVLLTGSRQRPPDYFEISKNLDIFGKALREISLNYVDEVEVNAFVRVGIEAMFASLDPYTNYYSSSEIEDYRFLSTGQYGGIGTVGALRSGRYVVTEVAEGSPAAEADVRVGDELVRIDNQVLLGTGLSAEVIGSLLRGQPGTSVEVELRRGGEASPRVVKLPRQDLRVPNVPFFTDLGGGVAYVVLAGFTRDASREVQAALERVKQANGGTLKGIVLDLRGNPGGLLYEAIAVSNLFVGQGEVIVETRGRMEGSVEAYLAPNVAYDTETPLTVLVDGGSASASEIVAGVMQDLDRGVVVGQRSFGKGLVQTTRPLSYNAQMKLTTAKYYTPSGRCIQELDYTQRATGVVRRTDSLEQVFRTRAGRPVYEGQGIRPDVPAGQARVPGIVAALDTAHLIFDFATRYRAEHPELASPKTFSVDPALYQAFLTFVQAQGFAYQSPAQVQLERLRAELAAQGYAAALASQITALEQALTAQANSDFTTYRVDIARALEREIVRRYTYQSGVIESTFDDDPMVLEALALLNDTARYTTLLAGNR